MIKANHESKPASEPAVPASDRAVKPARGHVLVIDDDDGYSALLTRALVKGGFSVARAANGAEAFVEVESTDFDVALLDVHLPDAHGPDLIATFHAKRPRLQVIVMTAQGSISVAVRSVRAGAVEFVEKTTEFSGLLRTVEHALQHRRVIDETALYRACQAIFDAGQFERLPETLVTIARQVMSADAVSLLLPGPDGKLYVAHAYGLAPEVQSSTRIAVGGGICRPRCRLREASDHQRARLGLRAVCRRGFTQPRKVEYRVPADAG